VIRFLVEDKIGVQLVTLNLFPEEERFGGKGENAKSICAGDRIGVYLVTTKGVPS